MATIPTLDPDTFRRVDRITSVVFWVLWVLAAIALSKLWADDASSIWTAFWGLFLVVNALRLLLLPRLDPGRSEP